MICPDCRFDNPEGATYCGMCGSRQNRPCPLCATPIPRTFRFCVRCGTSLTPDGDGAAVEMRREHERPRTPPSTDHATQNTRPPVEDGGDEFALLDGERRVATIVLADIQGSTNLLEKVGSERWVEIMNRVFRLLEAEIYRFGGKVDQFRGDGLLAFFGTGIAHEDDPERGVLAAIAMQRAIRVYAAELAKGEAIDLSLRVGVNTGEVIVANVGDHRTYSEDTAMGEAIALAARIEQAAEAGTVLVSENTYRLTESQFDWLPLGEIELKGIRDPVAVYRPLAPRFTGDQTQDYDLKAPLIGREAELQLLINCVDELRQGRGGIVMLIADRGMGKSLLLQEARRYFTRYDALLAEVEAIDAQSEELPAESLAAHVGPPLTRELRGRARSYDQSQPYGMWHDLMRAWLGIRKDESRENIRDRLKEETTVLWGDHMEEFYPDLVRFLGLPLEPAYEERLRQSDAETTRQRLFLAIRSWVEALAQQGPLVISFSDIHWADTTSLDLLRYCLPLCDYLDLMWLLVFRPDRRSTAWELRHHIETEYPHRLTTLTLDRLTDDEIRALIDHMIGPDVLPAETLDMIVQKAEGNPFYTHELVRALMADGILVRRLVTEEEGETVEQWEATQAVTSLSLPDSLQGLLLARIDRLAPTEQQILQRAAVIGSIFWSNVLQAVSPDIPDLRAQLTALQRAQLITERGRVPELGVEYVFESKLIRDAAYDSLLSPHRTMLHLQIAEYLESACAEDAAAQEQGLYLGALVYHYHHAKRPDRELCFTLKNAERAKAIYANAEASQYYTHALELLDQLEDTVEEPRKRRTWLRQRCRILIERHKLYYLLARFDRMRADAEAALPLARELADDDPTLLIDALLEQPGISDHRNRHEINASMPLAQEAIALSRKLGDPKRELESVIAVINQRLVLSDPEWQPLAEEALELARRSGERSYEARLLVGMGGIYAFGDEPERGMHYLEAAAALAMSEGIEDKVVQMALLNLLGLEFERTGDYYRLLTEYQQERLHASREIGHHPMESEALQACGRIKGIYLGDQAGGLSALEECRHILEGSRHEVYPLFHVTQILVAEADHDGARAALAEIEEKSDLLQDRAQASRLLVEAILLNAEGARAASRADPDRVVERLEQSLKISHTVMDLAEGSPLVSQQYEMAACTKATVAYLGLAQTVKGREAEYLDLALKTAERGHAIYQRFGFAQVVECVSEEVLFRYSQALAADHQADAASRYLRRAYDEMMRKHALIPSDSHYRRTYLEQIPLHREIRAAYAARIGSILTDASLLWNPPEAAAAPTATDLPV